ncbi:MAG TPA: Spy/CpxP family protein refolding chaperone [Terriglobales bacterium]|nr:Spy/CpxP family protein refolding chaperone [Terriglobales bacterium]
MKSHRMKIFIAAVALLLVGAVALAQTVRRAAYRHGGGMFGERMLSFYAHRLDLTDAQQSQLKDIMAKERPALKPLFLQLSQTRHQMRQLEEGETFNEAQVRTLAAQQSQVMTELIVQKARIESEMLQVLNPDQKTKFKEMMDKREQRMMNHMQNQSTDNQNTQQN